jgi:hypothetical protein
MECLGMQSSDRTGKDEGPTRRDQEGGLPPLPADEPDYRPEQPNGAGVVDAWFFLGW